MNQFKRAEYSPAQAAPQALAKEQVHPDYAPYSSIDTGVQHYPADVTIAGLDQALGSRIARLLLLTDAESTLHVGAKVLADHALSSHGKDLQANLMVNVVKEMAQAEESAASERRKFCDDMLRRCTLEPDFKTKVRKELLENNAVQSSQISVLPMV